MGEENPRAASRAEGEDLGRKLASAGSSKDGLCKLLRVSFCLTLLYCAILHAVLSCPVVPEAPASGLSVAV